VYVFLGYFLHKYGSMLGLSIQQPYSLLIMFRNHGEEAREMKGEEGSVLRMAVLGCGGFG
jgi:hypothetical protein